MVFYNAGKCFSHRFSYHLSNSFSSELSFTVLCHDVNLYQSVNILPVVVLVWFSSPVPRINGHSKSERTARDSAMGYDSASVMSSELESSSFVDSEEDEDASR